MKSLLISFQFLTIIPIKIRHNPGKKDFSSALICFPLVGLFIGALLTSLNIILTPVLKGNLLNLTLIVFLAVITGGLHLDGLADTFDGMAGRKGKEETLRIMKESHIGTMGVLSLISAFLFKLYLLSAITAPLKNTALLLMPVISRWNLVLLIKIFNYARENGKAKIFFEGINLKVFFAATIIAVGIALIVSEVYVIFLFFITAIFSYVFAKHASNRLGGITGDILGAVNEISEITVLFSIYLFPFIWKV